MFVGVSVQHVALCCVCVCVRCLWDSFEQVCVSECAAGGFVLCVSCVCDACGTFWSRFGGVSVQQVALLCVCVCVCVCCVLDCLEQV